MIRILILILATWVGYTYFLFPIRVKGISMEPAYPPGSIHLVYRRAYASARPQRGDVVCIRMAGATVTLLKRVIGLPGEIIEIRAGTVYINDEPLDEPYVLRKREPWNDEKRTLARDECFFLGDNRSMLMADQETGVTELSRIAGKVIR